MIRRPPRSTLFPYTNALPISQWSRLRAGLRFQEHNGVQRDEPCHALVRTHTIKTIDRKSTRLNSSHTVISYAVFCLKKKTAPARPVLGPKNLAGRGACDVAYI